MAPIAGSEFELQADLVLLAMGFIHPVHDGLVEELALEKMGAAMSQPTRRPMKPRAPKPLLVVICAAANRWSSGPFAKAASRP